MNRKGFTLIELIATIALLAVIVVISFVSISAVIKQSKVNDCESLVKSIKSAAKEYVSDNRYNFTSNAPLTITGETLNGYLTSPIVNPFDNSSIAPGSIRIKIELKADYTAKNVIIEAPSILSSCNN